METFAQGLGDRATEVASPDRQHLHAHVIHHTHWDREWWATFQDFRIRLVETIDALLEILDTHPSFRTFLLDGQVSVLHDYLEIRPENREQLIRYLRDGRLQCGPWYILPDEFLVGGEAHLRNLLLARRVARGWDIPLLAIGYLPDTFGHIAQMPQLLHGFGIDNAFLWRGLGGKADALRAEFLWQAPDGSEVLAHWFPDGYYQMPFLHFDNPDRPPEDKLGRVHAAFERLGARATTDVILMPYGGDHCPPDPRLAEKIARANEDLGGRGDIQWSTPDTYLAAIRERNPRLARIRGELRAFGEDNPHVLPGVLSARLYLKRLNFTGESWLGCYAEPLSAAAWLRGRRYDAGLLWKAWELLIENHPHDSICGCSIDEVHREMLTRFSGSRQIAQIVSEKCVQHINDRIDTSYLEAGERALVVHNPLPRSRGGWASVLLARCEVDPRTHRLMDADGHEIAFAVRELEEIRPMTDRYRFTEIGFVADAVPGLGYRTYRLSPRARPLDPKTLHFHAIQPAARLKGGGGRTDLSLGSNMLENTFLQVQVETRDGSLTVTDKRSGAVYRGLNTFEDSGDAGDTYNYSAPLNDMVMASSTDARIHVSVAEAGDARATLRVDLDWLLPAGLNTDRYGRSSEYVQTRISTFVTLMASTPRVDIVTEWENRTTDHRLRALFPLGGSPAVSHASGQFAVTHRPVGMPVGGAGWDEPPVPEAPLHDWVSVDDGVRGLTLATCGLPEYAVSNSGHGTIALTLLRAVGWLSREDLIARVGGAGPQVPVPDAQSLGHNRVQYSIIPHAGTWLESSAYREAEEYLTSLYGSITGRHPGSLPSEGGLVSLEGEHTLVPSACKKSEIGEAMILRFWNAAQRATRGRLCFGLPVQRVYRVNMAEEPFPGGQLEPNVGGSYLIDAGPAEIVTLAVEF